MIPVKVTSSASPCATPPSTIECVDPGTLRLQKICNKARSRAQVMVWCSLRFLTLL